MSALSFLQKSSPRRTVVAAGASALILAGIGYGGWLLLRRPARPAAETAVTTVVQPAVLEGTGKAGDLAVTEEAMQLAEIRVAPVGTRLVAEKLTVSGVMEPGGDRVAKITPRVRGKVVSLSAVVGDRVRAGQTLGLIESVELAQAQAAYHLATARLGAARTGLARQRELARLGQFGQPQLEQARTRAVDAEQQIHDARHHLQTEKAELASAESRQRALAAMVTQAESQITVARSRLNRAQTLFKEELVSRQEVEQAQADYQKAQSDMEVARANVAQGEAHIQSAKAKVDAAEGEYELAQKRGRILSTAQAREEKVYQGRFLTSKEIVEAETAARQAQLDQQAAAQAVRLLGGTPGGGSVVALTAPISGRVQTRNVSMGETIHTEQTAFTIVNLDILWAQLAVAPADLLSVHPGLRVELVSEAAPSHVFVGTVETLGSAADETTRAVPVRVSLLNRDGLLRPGAFVRGTIVTRLRRERVVVPTEAIQEHTGKKTVYVAKEGKPGAFEVRHVKLGVQGDGWREIASLLAPGERIAISGTFYLKSEALKSSLSDGCCAVDKGK